MKFDFNKNSSFEGVFAATLIPLKTKWKCNTQELAKHCRDLINRGCRGIALFGTTGEGSSFSVKERKQILKALIDLGIDPQQIILGICCSSIADAVELSRAALKASCLGVLVVPPFFYKNVSEEGVIDFYRDLIEKVDDPNLRMILYHIPQYSGVPLSPHIIKTLNEEFPEIVIGMKDSEGNESLLREVIKQIPNFNVMVGREVLLSKAVQFGARGAISGMANAFPELLCSLYEHGKDRSKPDRNGELNRLLELLKKFPIFPALKSIIESRRGKDWHILRPPLVPLKPQEREEINL